MRRQIRQKKNRKERENTIFPKGRHNTMNLGQIEIMCGVDVEKELEVGIHGNKPEHQPRHMEKEKDFKDINRGKEEEVEEKAKEHPNRHVGRAKAKDEIFRIGIQFVHIGAQKNL